MPFFNHFPLLFRTDRVRRTAICVHTGQLVFAQKWPFRPLLPPLELKIAATAGRWAIARLAAGSQFGLPKSPMAQLLAADLLDGQQATGQWTRWPLRTVRFLPVKVKAESEVMGIPLGCLPRKSITKEEGKMAKEARA